jgi:hypothetical protein
MTYYRLAVQDRQSTHLPQDGIRVFNASSEEALNEMLSRQNKHLESDSVTATQFLRERNIVGGEQLQYATDRRLPAHTDQQETVSNAWATWEMHKAAQGVQQGTETATMGTLSRLEMSLQEKKRLEIELGPGGDHDMPYVFTLPITQNEQLAWIRLQKQVQGGELLP